MKLTVAERIHLLSIVPAQGKIGTIRTVRGLREMLDLAEEEMKAISLQQDGTRLTWNAAAADGQSVKDYPITPPMRDVVEKRLRELDRKEEITVAHLSLWDKFVEMDETQQEMGKRGKPSTN